MKKKVGISRNNLDNEIVRVILKKQEIRYTDLKIELDVSDPTLWKHITKLQKEKTILVTKKGKEKWYRLSTDYKNNPLSEFNIGIFNYVDSMFWELRKIDYNDYTNFQDYIKDITGFITAYFFNLILSSFNDGRDNIKQIDFIEMFYAITEYTEKFIVGFNINIDDIDEDIPGLLQESNDYFKAYNKMIKNNPKYRKNLKRLFKELELLYPKDTHRIKNPKYLNFGKL